MRSNYRVVKTGVFLGLKKITYDDQEYIVGVEDVKFPNVLELEELKNEFRLFERAFKKPILKESDIFDYEERT